MTPSALSFTLGPGLRLSLPRSGLDRVETVTWQGLSYQAGPLELAFIPKAIASVRLFGRPLPRPLDPFVRLPGLARSIANAAA